MIINHSKRPVMLGGPGVPTASVGLQKVTGLGSVGLVGPRRLSYLAPLGGGVPGLLPDYKWTNNYIAGAGGVQRLVADIGGVNFEQPLTPNQPQDGGNKLEFDGVDDFMGPVTTPLGPHDLFCEAGKSFTFAIRFKGKSATAFSGSIWDKGRGGVSDRSFAPHINNTAGLRITLRNTLTVIRAAGIDDVDSTLIVTWDGSTALAYDDAGVPIVCGVGATSDVPTTHRIGVVDGSAGLANYFDGDIFEVRIYNQTLMAPQVLTAYNEMNP